LIFFGSYKLRNLCNKKIKLLPEISIIKCFGFSMISFFPFKKIVVPLAIERLLQNAFKVFGNIFLYNTNMFLFILMLSFLFKFLKKFLSLLRLFLKNLFWLHVIEKLSHSILLLVCKLDLSKLSFCILLYS